MLLLDFGPVTSYTFLDAPQIAAFNFPGADRVSVSAPVLF
jgi:hypothetical protein